MTVGQLKQIKSEKEKHYPHLGMSWLVSLQSEFSNLEEIDLNVLM